MKHLLLNYELFEERRITQYKPGLHVPASLEAFPSEQQIKQFIALTFGGIVRVIYETLQGNTCPHPTPSKTNK